MKRNVGPDMSHVTHTDSPKEVNGTIGQVECGPKNVIKSEGPGTERA